MTYSANKNVVTLLAKTALLEHELAEAIYAQEHDEHRLDKSFKNKVAGLLVIVGIVAVWIFYAQFSEMTSQIRILSRQAQQAAAVSGEIARQKQQLDIAQQQVNATMLNAQVIRDQARREQRAWAWLTGIALRPLTVNQPIGITANTVNSGKTFAFHAERTNDIVVATREPTTFPRLGKWKNLGLLTPNFIYADTFKGTEGLAQSQIDAINSGELLVVMYGTLKYRDVFNIHHFTKYCVVYTPDTNGFSSCNKHNSTN